MLNGSPPSNRNAGGPGLDRQIVPGPSLIFTEAMPRRPRRRADTSNDHQESLGDKTRSDADASEAPNQIHHHIVVFATIELLARISPGTISPKQDRTDFRKRLRPTIAYE